MTEAADVASAVARACPPAVVLAVFAVGLFQSLWLVIKKPFTKTPEGAWATPSAAVSDSAIGKPEVLLWYRLLSCLHCLSIAVTQLSRRGRVTFLFYTVWSYWLLAIYFGLAAWVSIRAKRRRRAGKADANRKVDGLEYAVISIFHVTSTTVWIVDSIAWLVLWPMLKAGDPAKREHWVPLFFCWTAYNQHGVNAVQMLIELALNRLPISFYMMGFVGLWSTAYGVWALSVYMNSGHWIYPFLDYTKVWAPVAYIGVYFVHWAFFGVVLMLKSLKERRFPEAAPQLDDRPHQKAQ